MGLAQNEMKAKPALPERVRSMEGLGIALRNGRPTTLTNDQPSVRQCTAQRKATWFVLRALSFGG